MLYPIASVKDWTPEQWIALVTVLIPALGGLVISIINAINKAPAADLKATDTRASDAKSDAAGAKGTVDALVEQMKAINNRLDMHASQIGEVQRDLPPKQPSVTINPPVEIDPVPAKTKGSK